MTEADLETMVRQTWRRSELREKLYRELEIHGNDYIEQILINVALMGYRARELDIWLNPFRIKASIDQVFNPPDAEPSSPPRPEK